MKKFIATVLTLSLFATPVCLSASALNHYTSAMYSCGNKGDYSDDCIQNTFKNTVPSLPVKKGSEAKFFWDSWNSQAKEDFEAEHNNPSFYKIPDGLITPKGNIIHNLKPRDLYLIMLNEKLSDLWAERLLSYVKKANLCSDNTSKEFCNDFERLHSLFERPMCLLSLNECKEQDNEHKRAVIENAEEIGDLADKTIFNPSFRTWYGNVAKSYEQEQYEKDHPIETFFKNVWDKFKAN